MNLRKTTFLGFIVLLAVAMTSCGTLRRAGKDIGVTALSPLIVLYGAGTDGMSSALEVRDGVDGGAASEVIALPFTFTWHAVRHTLMCAAHAVDFFLFPIYGAAELHPYGPEIEPLDYYTGTFFDKKPGDGKSGTDADSGETSDG